MTGTPTGNRYKKDLAIDLMRREVIEDGTTHTPQGTWQTNAETGIAWHCLFVSASETEIVWKTSVYKGGVIDSPDFYVARLNRVSGTLSTSWASGQCRRIEAKDRVLQQSPCAHADGRRPPCSHSIATGGLPVTSYATRDTPSTSLTMRREQTSSSSCGRCARCAACRPRSRRPAARSPVTLLSPFARYWFADFHHALCSSRRTSCEGSA